MQARQEAVSDDETGGMLVAAFHSVAMQWSDPTDGRTDGQWRETQYRLMRRQQLLLPAPADRRCLPPG